MAECAVAGYACPCVRLSQEGYPRLGGSNLFHDGGRGVGASVVDYNQFPVGVCLRLTAPDGFLNPLLRVEERHKDGYKRLIHKVYYKSANSSAAQMEHLPKIGFADYAPYGVKSVGTEQNVHSKIADTVIGDFNHKFQ